MFYHVVQYYYHGSDGYTTCDEKTVETQQEAEQAKDAWTWHTVDGEIYDCVYREIDAEQYEMDFLDWASEEVFPKDALSYILTIKEFELEVYGNRGGITALGKAKCKEATGYATVEEYFQ